MMGGPAACRLTTYRSDSAARADIPRVPARAGANAAIPTPSYRTRGQCPRAVESSVAQRRKMRRTLTNFTVCDSCDRGEARHKRWKVGRGRWKVPQPGDSLVTAGHCAEAE